MKMQAAKIRELQEQNKTRAREHERKLQEQNMKIQEQENSISDLKKHMDEWDQKWTDLTGELNRAREDVGAKVQPSVSSPPKFYKSNIRPRMAQILPSIGTVHIDMERKRKSPGVSQEVVPSKMSRSSDEEAAGKEVYKKDGKRDLELTKSKLDLLSSTLENIVKTSITSIRARKRKIADDIDLK